MARQFTRWLLGLFIKSISASALRLKIVLGAVDALQLSESEGLLVGEEMLAIDAALPPMFVLAAIQRFAALTICRARLPHPFHLECWPSMTPQLHM